jgi:hydroxymethylpyrimidine/phosphomethylpyrimidine kinase
MIPVALTIAGSDPSGGAGLQADLKTFHQLGVYGASVVTLLTVQNTRGVQDLKMLEPAFVDAQLVCVLEDLKPAALKTGALGSAGIIDVVSHRLSALAIPAVIDPVLVSKHGDSLAADDVRETLVKKLLPCAHVVTPNRYEAAVLSGVEISDFSSAVQGARAICEMGPRAVVIKGLVEGGRSVDVLWQHGEATRIESELVETRSTHGTGCTFSAAITAELASGSELLEAVGRAKRFVAAALASAPGLGSGIGPVDHHAAPPHRQRSGRSH